MMASFAHSLLRPTIRPKMHRRLLVAENFSHITYFSTADTRGGLLGKREVYRLALTCKAFSEPALHAVWREIHGLVILIYLLPAKLWRGIEAPADAEINVLLQSFDWAHHNSQSTCCMTSDTVESDWTSFLVTLGVSWN